MFFLARPGGDSGLTPVTRAAVRPSVLSGEGAHCWSSHKSAQVVAYEQRGSGPVHVKVST
jgi:hypothetical protein